LFERDHIYFLALNSSSVFEGGEEKGSAVAQRQSDKKIKENPKDPAGKPQPEIDVRIERQIFGIPRLKKISETKTVTRLGCNLVAKSNV
jgi:hypothetical protein